MWSKKRIHVKNGKRSRANISKHGLSGTVKVAKGVSVSKTKKKTFFNIFGMSSSSGKNGTRAHGNSAVTLSKLFRKLF